MCQLRYQVETDSPPFCLWMPARGGEYSGAHLNIYCTWARVFPADNAPIPFCVLPLTCIFNLSDFSQQNQAEAHYKGHKHARKLKAVEAQKNRQRRATDGSSAGRERERSKMSADATLPAPTDTSLEKESSRKSAIFVTDLPQLSSASWLL